MRLDARTIPQDVRCFQIKDIFLNGERVAPGTVLVLDDDAGELLKYVIEDNQVVLDDIGIPKTETVQGVVTYT